MSGEKDFQCSKCGKGFNTLEGLGWHVTDDCCAPCLVQENKRLTQQLEETSELRLTRLQDKANLLNLQQENERLKQLIEENRKSFRENLHRMRKGNKMLIAENNRLKADYPVLIEAECKAFSNWLCNTVIAGRTITKLWIDYVAEVGAPKIPEGK